MSLLGNLFNSTSKSAPYLVPNDWMPFSTKMKRVVVHWTGGSYVASSLDKEHYHFLVEGDLDVIRGLHSVLDNEVIGNKSQDEYAAHTKGTNTGAIGVSMCSMAGGEESPFKPGKFPVTEKQWQRTAEVVASLCKRYAIPVTDKTVLTHAEVQTNLGIKQNGKWDIAKLAFGNSLTDAKSCGDDFRNRVKSALEKI
jgi:N-acetyl-anhydromuramyl-L-alanine amidase AmpD